jgi:PadR family transcriptional regulator PadR
MHTYLCIMLKRASNARLLRGTLDLLLLQALRQGPRHGYAIARHIETETGDALSVEEGSMYPALYKLEGRGFVRGRWTTNASGRRARVYSLTTAGRGRLMAELRDWIAFTHAIKRLVGEGR